LAASVRDAVREAGFPKPRMEGEANGEWVIVDCGQAVVHIMQPNFRQYYNLEELWGEKPVRLKLGAAKPVVKEVAKPVATKVAAKPLATLKRSNAAKIGVAEAFQSKAQVKKNEDAARSAARKPVGKPAAARKSAAKPVADVPVTKVVIKAPAKKTVAKTVAKTTVKKAPAKKASPRKA
jgi:ribosome-associated protein